MYQNTTVTYDRLIINCAKVSGKYYWTGDDILSKHFPLRVQLYWAEFMYERDAMTKEQYENLAVSIKDLISKGYE